MDAKIVPDHIECEFPIFRITDLHFVGLLQRVGDSKHVAPARDLIPLGVAPEQASVKRTLSLRSGFNLSSPILSFGMSCASAAVTDRHRAIANASDRIFAPHSGHSIQVCSISLIVNETFSYGAFRK
jgi:hypothetical protein